MLVVGGIDACGSCARRPRVLGCAHLVTLCRFDGIYPADAYLRPFIPCERRLANIEILEIQGRGFTAGFWNRDYARPHALFPSTLWIID